MRRQDIDINRVSFVGYTPLNAASRRGHVNVVQRLLACKDIDVSLATWEKWQAIHYTVDRNYPFITELLLQYGASPNAMTDEGITPIYLASHHGYDTILAKLTAVPTADVNLPAKDGFTALYAASQSGYDSCVAILIKSGADLNVANKNGATALYVATENNHPTCVDLLVKAGADTSLASNNWTPLYKACLEGNEKCVASLIPYSDIEAQMQTKKGKTPVYAACQIGHKSCLELLLRADANPSKATVCGQLPLNIAVENGNIECVELLLRYKVFIDWPSPKSPIQIAKSHRRSEIEAMLQAYLAKPDKYHNDPLARGIVVSPSAQSHEAMPLKHNRSEPSLRLPPLTPEEPTAPGNPYRNHCINHGTYSNAIESMW